MRKRLVATLIGLVLAIGWAMPAYAAVPAVAPAAGPQVTVFAADSPAVSKLKTSWSWYVSRASGILAAILLALLVVSGVGLLTGVTYKVLEPLPAWAAHRAIGLAFGAMVLLHVFVLLFDKFVGFDLSDLLVPFHSGYKPETFGGITTSWYMALGIIALYCIVIVIVTSLLWMQKRPKLWQLLHFLSYVILGAVFIHGLYMGTDTKSGAVRVLWIAGTVVLVWFITTRLRRAGTIGKRK